MFDVGKERPKKKEVILDDGALVCQTWRHQYQSDAGPPAPAFRLSSKMRLS